MPFGLNVMVCVTLAKMTAGCRFHAFSDMECYLPQCNVFVYFWCMRVNLNDSRYASVIWDNFCCLSYSVHICHSTLGWTAPTFSTKCISRCQWHRTI